MAKRARGSSTRPGQRAPIQRTSTRPPTSSATPATTPAGDDPITETALGAYGGQSLTDADLKRAAALEAQIVAEEKAAEAAKQPKKRVDGRPSGDRHARGVGRRGIRLRGPRHPPDHPHRRIADRTAHRRAGPSSRSPERRSSSRAARAHSQRRTRIARATIATCHPLDVPRAPGPKPSSSPRPSGSRWPPGCDRATSTEFVGQEHLVGERGPLRRSIARGHLASLLLWGPPGTGKTSLARLLAGEIGAHFVSMSAVMSGVVEVRATIAEAQDRLALHGTRTILFLDEIHRFNKAQQDALLPHVEDGTVTLIGATTENPYFEVNAALLSRMRVWRLEPLTDDDVATVVRRALDDRGARAGRAARTRRRRRPDDRRVRPPGVAGRWRCPLGAQRARRRDAPWPRSEGDPRPGRPGQPDASPMSRRPPSSASSPTTAPATGTTTPSVRVHQEPARQRPRRGALLAGGDDRGRRGPQVHRPAADHQRVRGRRQRRSAGAAGRGRRRPGARLDRPARGAVRPGPGDDLHRHRAEVEPLGPGLLGRRLGRRGAAGPCPSRSTCGMPPTAG